jgi:5'-3' exonuclease
MLLDSASMYFRSFFGVPDNVVAPDGTIVNAVKGFLDAIAFLVSEHRPTHLVAAMDMDWRPAWRVEAVPSYKAHRVAPEGGEEVPDTLSPQVPIIEAALDALGICRIGMPDAEADDVIGTLATTATMPVEIVTGDRDLFQLVDDARDVAVLYIAKGFGNRERIDEAEITRRYDIPGRAYADFATMRGDTSDGLPGVPGIGEKTAATLLRTFGDLDGILAAAALSDEGFPRGCHAKLLASIASIPAMRRVVAVARDLPIGSVSDAVPASPPNAEALDALAERWGLRNAVARVLEAFVSVHS